MSFYPVQAQNFKLHGAGVTIGSTTCKLTSLAQIDGTLLTMADFGSKGYMTVEPGVTNEEQISFTGITQNADGTATLTGVSCVGFVSPYTETSGFCNVHVGGSIAVASNTAGFYDQFLQNSNAESITGTWTFAVASWPRVDNSATLPTQDAYLATKKYVDGVAIAGSPVSGTNTLGISKLSTAAVSATQPIVVGDNDTRLPTQGENDALVGTRGTPSSTNKFVTNDDTSSTGTTQYVARYSGTGLLTVATTPTNTTDAASKAYVDRNPVLAFTNNTTNSYNITGSGTNTVTLATLTLPAFPYNYGRMLIQTKFAARVDTTNFMTIAGTSVASITNANELFEIELTNKGTTVANVIKSAGYADTQTPSVTIYNRGINTNGTMALVIGTTEKSSIGSPTITYQWTRVEFYT